ncbi:MAG: hypothetical protein HDT42_02795 [Ruminococcaceae bacterium]|nr:hypothetical protein [Oscillospiraceae bacterium]
MTDKQLKFIVGLIADKILSCKDMEEVKKAVDEMMKMVNKKGSKDKNK